MSEFIHGDCLEYMRKMPDNAYDLAIVDPPYNIPRLRRPQGRLEKYGDTRTANNNAPTAEYFEQLFRVSKTQIIWGGNYFDLPPCRCFVIWYKHQPIKNYSEAEYAWTNIDAPAKLIDLPYFGGVGADDQRIHPTQKPVALYEELLMRFAKKGDKILDTHAGSGSSLIACYNLGFEYTGFEIDDIYYEKACKRIADEQAQIRMELNI